MDEDDIIKRLMASQQFKDEGNERGAQFMQPQLSPEERAAAMNSFEQQKAQALQANQMSNRNVVGSGMNESIFSGYPQQKAAEQDAQKAEQDAIRFGRLKQMLRTQGQ